MHRTLKPVEPVVGGWWRFSGYELKDGYIRPAAGAKLFPYDPWGQPERSDARPYEELANLVRRGTYAVGNRTLTPATEAALLAWCHRYGLLGVLLQRLETVVLAARIETDDNDHYRTEVQFRRTPRGWQEAATHDRIDGAETETAPREPAGVMLHPLDSLHTVFEPFGRTWARFFPSVQAEHHESYPYPQPQSADFWALYQEPVEEFFGAAALLERALTTLAKGRETLGDRKTRPSAVDDYSLAVHKLNSYVGTVRWCLEPEQDRFVQRWMSPALFSSLAMMALQDVASHRAPRICLTCQGLFVSSAYQARYCSVRCRQTMNKRTFRENVRRKNQRKRKRRKKRV